MSAHPVPTPKALSGRLTPARSSPRISQANLRRAQAVSGLVFALFLALHLGNTWLAGLSPEAYDGFQGWIRPLYQSWLAEPIILGALVAHLAVAVLRKRGGRPAPIGRRSRWHRNAGIFLALVVFGHVAAVRGASFVAGVHPGFAGLTFTLAHVPGYFYPYYLLFGAAALYHGLNGLAIAGSRLGWRVRLAQRSLLTATAVGSALVLLALLGFGGVLYEIDDPYDNDFARLMLDMVGDTTP